MSAQQRKLQSNDLAEQRLKERIKFFITDSLRNPEEVVSNEELTQYLRLKFPEYQRKSDSQLKKQVSWHLNKLYSEVSNTNIQKQYFKKKDFISKDYLSSKKQDVDRKEAQNDGESDVDSKSSQDSEEDLEKAIVDNIDEKLINYKSPNLLNQMLPYAQNGVANQVKEEAKTNLGKRNPEDDTQGLENEQKKGNAATNKRRQMDQGYAKFLQEQKSQDQMNKELEKYLINSTLTFKDLGGIHNVIGQLKEMIEWPLKYKNIFGYLGVKPPRGILISGPPGSGKTQLALAISGEYPDIPFYKLNGPEIVSRLSGQSEEKIRNIFNAVKEKAPAIIFIDELDSIAGKREEASKDMEVRIVAQLAACLDDIDNTDAEVVVIGATTRPETIDQGLRRAGRFEKELTLGVPNEESRIDILKILTRKMRLQPELDFKELVKLTPGYVGADISTLCKEASVLAVSRIIQEQVKQDALKKENEPTTEIEDPAKEETEEKEDDNKDLEKMFIEMNDFKLASKRVQPSAQREGFSTVPNTTWKDVGALDKIRAELQMSIVEPILHPDKFKRVGLTAPAGVLLYGPPGCGKTLVAKAVSNESKANFISIKGPELLNKYVGESEKAVRQLFKRARASAPCVIFFDELDSLCPRRGSENNTSSERVVNQLLTELDGLDDRRDVFVIAATNRPDIIDPAMLRPGRLDKLLYVPLPTKEDKLSILKTLTRSLPLSKDVQLKTIAASDQCEGYSGADLSALLREAQLNALKANIEKEGVGSELTALIEITMRDFTIGLSKVFPSVSKKDEQQYMLLEKSLRKSRSHINNTQA